MGEGPGLVLKPLSSGAVPRVNRRGRNFGVARASLGLYSCGLGLALVLTAPWWLRELRAAGKYREGWRERLGRIAGERLRAPERGQTVVWVHAVSVGEMLAAAPLIAGLRRALPQARVFVSTTTRTGQSIARSRFGAEQAFYFPLDFAFAVRAWLRFLRPSLVVLVESEFWPRFLFECNRRRVPVAVVNARVSSRSWPRYRRLRALWRPLLGTLAVAHAQTSEDAERLLFLGATHALAGGNLKYDLQPPRATPLVEMLKAALPAGSPLVVCGSTLPGDEDLLLRDLPTNTLLLLAPRHPERFGEVAALLAGGKRPWVRLSHWRLQPAPIEPESVLLLDSVGELAALYALATVAVIGGTFFDRGHNPLEAASLGKPVVMGPAYGDFNEIVRTLRAADAIVVAELLQLGPQVARLLGDPEWARALGERARAVCAQHTGATGRALAALLPLVGNGTRP